MRADTIEVSLDAVIMAVTDNAPRFLTVDGPRGRRAFPEGPLESSDPTLELGLRRWIREQTGLQVGYVEQLYTFGDRRRTHSHRPHQQLANHRLSITYLALVREAAPSGEAAWFDVYNFFPWEDHRTGTPGAITERILPALATYVADAPTERAAAERQERVQIMFGQEGAVFDGVRALERYELLYEAGLVDEAQRGAADDAGGADGADGAGEADGVEVNTPDQVGSVPMYLDHRRIAATALGRLRGKLTYRPVVFELLPPHFTLSQLQAVVESLAGVGLHKQNFRRLVDGGGLVEGTGQVAQTGGRPAELFRFRRAVLRERPRPGISNAR